MMPACPPEQRLEFRFQGCLDTAKCVQIETDLRLSLSRVNAPVVFDLQAVTFVSSAFLRLCVYAYRQAGDHGLHVVNLDPAIKRVFKIAGLDGMFQID